MDDFDRRLKALRERYIKAEAERIDRMIVGDEGRSTTPRGAEKPSPQTPEAPEVT